MLFDSQSQNNIGSKICFLFFLNNKKTGTFKKTLKRASGTTIGLTPPPPPPNIGGSLSSVIYISCFRYNNDSNWRCYLSTETHAKFVRFGKYYKSVISSIFMNIIVDKSVNLITFLRKQRKHENVTFFGLHFIIMLQCVRKMRFTTSLKGKFLSCRKYFIQNICRNQKTREGLERSIQI